MPLPPEHVLSAFHAETGATGTRRAQGDQLGPVWDNGIKVGDVVYSQAGPFAAWSCRAMAGTRPLGGRLPSLFRAKYAGELMKPHRWRCAWMRL